MIKTVILLIMYSVTPNYVGVTRTQIEVHNMGVCQILLSELMVHQKNIKVARCVEVESSK